jgi:hypothetical protein
MLLSEICFLISVGRHPWREDESAICRVITQWFERCRTLPTRKTRFPYLYAPGTRWGISCQLYRSSYVFYLTRQRVSRRTWQSPHRSKTTNFRQEVISGRKPRKGARHQDILTDRPSVVKWLRTSNYQENTDGRLREDVTADKWRDF